VKNWGGERKQCREVGGGDKRKHSRFKEKQKGWDTKRDGGRKSWGVPGQGQKKKKGENYGKGDYARWEKSGNEGKRPNNLKGKKKGGHGKGKKKGKKGKGPYWQKKKNLQKLS